ncbi:MAG: glycine cleavage system aminomethyltransferase GcvT [Candidatus Eisenbacteria bacterium]
MSPDETKRPLRTALYECHLAAGGKMVPFAGWEMPVHYSSILEEHRAVRERAGLFDVSHMGEFVFRGERREAEVDRITTARISDREPGEVQYALLLNDRGGIVDDILVYKMPDSVILVVNAANREKDLAWVKGKCGGGVTVEDGSARTSQIAVQGPRSREILAKITGADATGLPYYRALWTEVLGVHALVSRTGYTGELGFEIYMPWDEGPKIWDALLEAGADEGLVPIGLGARDSLRLEMRYCLYGNDIGEDTSPVEAGLGWTVRKKDGDFVGREAYLAAKANGAARKIVGFRLGPRDIPRPGYPVIHEGREAGTVTSGGFSPTLERGIALAYVDAAVSNEKEGFSIRIRNREAAAVRVAGSFVPSSVKDEGEE